MSFALKDLSRLLSGESSAGNLISGPIGGSVLGAVIGLDGELVRLATERGAVTARTLDALAIGDRVVIRAGMAFKAPVAREVFPV